MPEPILEVSDLKLSFGSNHVLKGVDLTIESGSITTIIGKSGTGKSVLLKTIARLLRPSSGKITLFGDEIFPSGWRSKRDARLSYLFQGNALFDSMTVADNVALPLIERTRTPKREVEKRVNTLLERLDVLGSSHCFPAELSGGMQRRVALARALITQPQLVLFDEPTTGLDPVRRATVFDMILKFQAEFDFTAAIVSHDVPGVFSISDRVAFLDQGRILFNGPPGELPQCDEGVIGEFVSPRNFVESHSKLRAQDTTAAP